MPINQNDITSIYQSLLGRSPTAGEIASFMQYANNGSVPLTSFDIQQIIQGTPEFQQQQLQNYGNQYNNLLGSSDQRILGLSQNNVTQQFAQQGRNVGSSGYLSAYANAAANLAMNRQQQLASFYGGGYQNILGSTVGQANGAQSNAIAQQNSTLGFQRQLQLLQQQQQFYQNSVNSQNKRAFGQSLLGLGAGIVGGAAGSYFGNLGAGRSSSGGSGGLGANLNLPNYNYGFGGYGGLGANLNSPNYNYGFGGYGGFQGTNSYMSNYGQ